ncbi:undecaprenyl-diphosphate phosphatase, partial [Bradyrhizobium sp.]|uniref:undecaprenyl-diphosphate phosphatase n=1 Tax=Bradyrhizobium sp. TaxID=376 RepID=UPI00391D8F23
LPQVAACAHHHWLVTKRSDKTGSFSQLQAVTADERVQEVARMLGGDKRSAAEFSFFLAIPTMVGAFVYDFYKSRAEMTSDHLGLVAIGFVVSFITAMIVVKAFLGYVTRHGFVLFAWWRVIVGTLGLIALALGK